MRATLLHTGAQSTQDLTDALKTAACDLLGCGITANAWEQATLPIRQGGSDIKDPSILRPVARLSALANFHAHGTDVGAPLDLDDFSTRTYFAEMYSGWDMVTSTASGLAKVLQKRRSAGR